MGLCGCLKKKNVVVSDTYWYATLFLKSEHGYHICLLKQNCHILNVGYVAFTERSVQANLASIFSCMQ